MACTVFPYIIKYFTFPYIIILCKISVASQTIKIRYITDTLLPIGAAHEVKLHRQ